MGTSGQAEPGLSSTSCSVDSAYTTRPSPDRTIAPVHMPHGWQLVYIVVRAAAPGLSSAAAQRASLSSGCAVMSLSRRTVLWATMMTRPPSSARRDPYGASFVVTASAAIAMARRRSWWSSGVIIGAPSTTWRRPVKAAVQLCAAVLLAHHVRTTRCGLETTHDVRSSRRRLRAAHHVLAGMGPVVGLHDHSSPCDARFALGNHPRHRPSAVVGGQRFTARNTT